MCQIKLGLMCLLVKLKTSSLSKLVKEKTTFIERSINRKPPSLLPQLREGKSPGFNPPPKFILFERTTIRFSAPTAIVCAFFLSSNRWSVFAGAPSWARAEWRCWKTGSGAPSAMINGTCCLPPWCAESWASVRPKRPCPEVDWVKVRRIYILTLTQVNKNTIFPASPCCTVTFAGES